MAGFKAHSKPIYELEFSPDGTQLLSSGGDKRVALWSVEERTLIQEWPATQLMAPIAFSPEGKYIGIAGYAIRVWPVGGSQSAILESTEWATSCAFSPDGTEFAASGAERAIMRWSIPSGDPLPGGWGGTRTTNDGARFPTGGMAYHPDGQTIANCYGVQMGDGFHSVIHFWDQATGTLKDTIDLGFSAAHPTRLLYSWDGKQLVADSGPLLSVWDMTTKEKLASLKGTLKHFKGFALANEDRTLMAVNSGAEIVQWDAETWSEGPAYDPQIGKLTAITVSSDGQAAVGSATGKIEILPQSLLAS